MRERSNRIWFVDTEKLKKLVKRSVFFSDILKELSIFEAGENVRTLRKRLSSEKIDFSHIKQGRGHWKGATRQTFQKPLNLYLIAGSKIKRSSLKRRLIDEGYLVEACSICYLQPVWNSNKLVLVLDHINGVYNDNRLENIRLLCPNCNSQTDTFAGRNVKRLRLLRESISSSVEGGGRL